MKMTKKKQLPLLENVEITGIAAEGKAIARVDGKVVFVPLACPGDVVDLQVVRKRSSYCEARIVRFHSYSPERVEPVCRHFGECGGCKWQCLRYDRQLFYKQQQVVDSLKRIGKLTLPEPEPIIGADHQFGYRNKVEFTFSNRRWLSRNELAQGGRVEWGGGVGFHIVGSFDKVIDIENCHLVGELCNRVRNDLRDFAKREQISFYDLKHQVGVMRSMMFRSSNSGESMLLLQFHCTNEEEERQSRDIIDYLINNRPELTNILWVNNLKGNDTILDREVHAVKGSGYMYCLMDDLKFKVGAKSFYQTNNEQALKLYTKVREYCELKGDELVYDLYTGTGTIALFLARAARFVIGVECVPEAIESARENARINEIGNVAFLTGDVKDIFRPDILSKIGHTEMALLSKVVVVDPPRVGMHPAVVESLLEAAPQRIVYVSCNPATQARDLSLLDGSYRVAAFEPVDMFPQTHHIENVALLVKR